MESSRLDIMTVREMIDAAVTFNDEGMAEPIVNIKLLEAVLMIIARHLNVLRRRFLIEMREKYKVKVKTTVAITEIKVHRRILKKHKDTTTTTDSGNEKSFIKHQHKRKRSRHPSRSRSKSKRRGRYSSEDDDDTRRYGRQKGSRGSRRKERRFRDDSQDILHERILVVSKTSLDALHQRDQRSPVVTQKQYDKLHREVRMLQEKFGVVSDIDFYKPMSLTDPRAALNMATRLDIAHKKLNKMITIVTKFAGATPGFDMEAPFIQIQSKDTLTSERTPKAISPSKSSLTEPEETLVAMDDFIWDEENLATWTQLNADMNEMRQDVVERVSVAATKATNTAESANKLFKRNAPKLSQASILNIKFARLRILYDRFINNATALETTLSRQMSECQEGVSQLQFEMDTIIGRIDDALAHPAEDPGAIAAAQGDFGLFQVEITDTQRKQDTFKELLELSALELERIRLKIGMISQIKTTREEALDYLKGKATVNDINSILSSEQLGGVVCFLQEEISNMNEVIHSGELTWQRCIEDCITYLNSKGDRSQLASLHHSLCKYISIANTKVNNMLDIVGEFPVIMYEKKLDRDGNCLSCGTPANVKLSKKNFELAKRLMNERRPIKPLAMEEEETEKCYPGRPIPQALDPRALLIDRYCEVSISKSEESLKTTMGIEVVDVNPAHTSDRPNTVHLTCTPCTHSEETYF